MRRQELRGYTVYMEEGEVYRQTKDRFSVPLTHWGGWHLAVRWEVRFYDAEVLLPSISRLAAPGLGGAPTPFQRKNRSCILFRAHSTERKAGTQNNSCIQLTFAKRFFHCFNFFKDINTNQSDFRSLAETPVLPFLKQDRKAMTIFFLHQVTSSREF